MPNCKHLLLIEQIVILTARSNFRLVEKAVILMLVHAENIENMQNNKILFDDVIKTK